MHSTDADPFEFSNLQIDIRTMEQGSRKRQPLLLSS